MTGPGIAALVLVSLIGMVAVATPRISADTPIYTAAVTTNAVTSHTFVLTNIGDQTLTISRVQTTCGCITASLVKSDLAPGESTLLVATLNTLGYGGVVSKSVEVESNDPTVPTLVLRLRLTILDEAQAQTPTIVPTPHASSPSSDLGTAPTRVDDAAVPQRPVWPLALGGMLALALLFLLVVALRGD